MRLPHGYRHQSTCRCLKCQDYMRQMALGIERYLTKLVQEQHITESEAVRAFAPINRLAFNGSWFQMAARTQENAK